MLKDIVYNNLSQALQFGSRWVFNIALISILDIKNYAIFSFVYSLSNILLSILPFGSSVYLISEVNNNEQHRIEILSNSVRITVLLFLITFLLYLILTPFINFVKGWEFIFYGIILGLVLSVNLIIFSYFKGIGDFKKELQGYFLFAIVILATTGYCYFFLGKIDDISLIFWLLIISNLLVTIFTCLFSSFKLKKDLFVCISKLNFKNIRRGIAERKYFGLQEILIAVCTQAGLLILFYILDENTYGYYRAIFVTVAPAFMLTVAISQVVLKYLKSKVIEKKKDLIVFFRKIQLFTTLLGLLLCLFLIVFRTYIFKVIKIDSSESTIYAFYLIVSIVFMRFVFSNYEMFLVALNNQKKRFQVILVAAILSIVSIFLLLPNYGLVGAVFTNAISYIAIFLGLLFIGEKLIKKIENT